MYCDKKYPEKITQLASFLHVSRTTWNRVKANKGSSGIDGISIEDIEATGVSRYLTEVQNELMNGSYRPKPVKRVMIPKPDGSERPLGIQQ